jgi:hypothetical protein
MLLLNTLGIVIIVGMRIWIIIKEVLVFVRVV